MIELTQKYVTEDAEKFVKNIADKIDASQLRKFYDDFKVLERKMNEQQNPSNEWFKKSMIPHIKFVGTKIVYSAGRKKSEGGTSKRTLVPEEFKKHILGEIDKIEKIDDFKHFLMHYQAIIAYFTYIKNISPESESQQKDQRADSKVPAGYNSTRQRR